MSSLKVTKIDKFDYLVLRTGYTSRTIGHYLNLGASIMTCEKEIKESENDYEDEPCKEEYEDSFSEKNYIPLFIEDNVWGEGFYWVNGKDQEKTDLKKILESTKSSGYLAFKIGDLFTSKSIIDKLISLRYCAGFDPSPYRMEFIESEDKKILVMHFDTESG